MARSILTTYSQRMRRLTAFGFCLADRLIFACFRVHFPVRARARKRSSTASSSCRAAPESSRASRDEPMARYAGIERNCGRAFAPFCRFRRVFVVGSSCVPHRDLPPDQIEKLAKLDDVMDVQATVADPQFKKMDQTAYTDGAAFADMGNRIQVTSTKIHQFSKGPEFDQLADRLHAGAETLSAAASAKDAAKASSTLASRRHAKSVTRSSSDGALAKNRAERRTR